MWVLTLLYSCSLTLFQIAALQHGGWLGVGYTRGVPLPWKVSLSHLEGWYLHPKEHNPAGMYPAAPCCAPALLASAPCGVLLPGQALSGFMPCTHELQAMSDLG